MLSAGISPEYWTATIKSVLKQSRNSASANRAGRAGEG